MIIFPGFQLAGMWTGTYWTGMNDRAAANVWAYDNGDVSAYTNWDMGHPIDFEPYNCVQVSSYGKWQAGRCDFTSEYFCMIKSIYFQIQDHVIYEKFSIAYPILYI